MSATVDFGLFKAIVRGGRWRLATSRDRVLGKQMVAYLNDHVRPASGADPDYDYSLATEAARELGGEIVAADTLPAFDPGVIY